MVQFGKRFETSQTRRWLRHNADYERLKLLLNLAGAAREREPAEKTIGLNNFGDRDNAGLLESDVVLAPGVFDSACARKAARKRYGGRTASAALGEVDLIKQHGALRLRESRLAHERR